MRRTLTVLLAALALTTTGVVAGLAAAGGSGTIAPPPRVAFLANGQVPADALAAGPVAGRLGAPMFTTAADVLAEPAEAGIVAYAPDLVVVLGGPVAIADAVVAQLAGATGLPLLDADQVADGTDGIVRVAGQDRYATARAVAGLVSAFDPAFLPVDATALGAVDADRLDGKDATAFARSNQSCGTGDVVAGIGADGTPVCRPDAVDGGDAETLDGLDAADLVPSGEVVIVSNDWTPVNQATEDEVSSFGQFGPYLSPATAGPWTFTNYPSLPSVIFGQDLELVGVEVCQRYYSQTITTAGPDLRVMDGETTLAQVSGNLGGFDGPDCLRVDLPTPVSLASGARAATQLSASSNGEIRYHEARYFLRTVTS